MKKLPLLQLWTSDEVASTHLLNPFELGCVFKLRFQLWENNSIPLRDDDNYLARICNTTPKKFKSARNNFDYLFEKKNGNIFHVSDKEKWTHALNKSKKLSDNANIRWNNDHAIAVQKDKELELKPELKPQLEQKLIDNGRDPRWNKYFPLFNDQFKSLEFKRGNKVQAVRNYLASIDDPLIDTPSIEELFVFYRKHQQQYSDQPRFITSLENYISGCKWEEDTSFEMKQSLKEKSEIEFQEEQDRKDWEFANRMGKWLPAYSSDRINRIEKKFGKIMSTNTN